jgi:hypothetical protein
MYTLLLLPHRCPGKTSSCRKKNRPKRAAFSLPQDSSAELMFEPCGNCRPGLSTWRCAGFRAVHHRASLAHCVRMRGKGLNRRADFTGAADNSRVIRLNRFRRHGFLSGTMAGEAAKRRRLPYVRRNAPEVCRKTPRCPAVSRACTLSPSTDADFPFAPVRASRFCRKQRALTLRYEHST